MWMKQSDSFHKAAILSVLYKDIEKIHPRRVNLLQIRQSDHDFPSVANPVLQMSWVSFQIDCIQCWISPKLLIEVFDIRNLIIARLICVKIASSFRVLLTQNS